MMITDSPIQMELFGIIVKILSEEIFTNEKNRKFPIHRIIILFVWLDIP